ncbi:hypothetical protein MP638_007453 [Amoeboaphelidium occidentale]|nr:hypothetical protein MP638_007453 [Amoeboaphelidium occidentale]
MIMEGAEEVLKVHAKDQKQWEQFCDMHSGTFKERWTHIINAFKEPTRHCYLINPFYEGISSFSEGEYGQLSLAQSKCMIPLKEQEESLELSKDSLKEWYALDAASVIAAEALNVQKGDKVLDLCAAPGGKSLVMAFKLFATMAPGDGAQLVCNEYQQDRRKRLQRVVQDYLPSDVLKHVVVTGHDGTEYSKRALKLSYFDRVLVDAPCSSDRHCVQQMIAKPGTFKDNWSASKPKKMAEKQLKLVLEAFKVLKKGGQILYSTCALSEQENDGVIRKALKKLGTDKLAVIKRQCTIGDETEFGILILPDKSQHGPMFYCLLKKL